MPSSWTLARGDSPALVLCVLISLTVSMGSGQAYEATAGGKRKEKVCTSIDIRNSVSNFKKLKGCTVIEGFLQVQLIDRAEPGEYANLSFPELREITGYFLLFRAKGLKSLRTLFPNLAVIRGSMVFHNYAFVVYEMFDLEEIGLRSLTHVLRGGVRVERNPHLCYVDSVDWDHIAPAAKGANFFRDNNEKSNECPNTCPERCPTRPNKGPLCWSQQDCQKKCDGSCGSSSCMAERTACCHRSCVGGCWNETAAACFVCRRFLFEQRCLDACPNDTFLYFGRRCLSESECKSIVEFNQDLKTNVTYKPFRGKCERECPSGYHTDPKDNSTCVRCEKECPKECPGGSVTNIADAEKLKGCTIIKGNLEIQISGAQDVVGELQANLNTIAEIHGQLKVIRSFPITSLNFLSSLRRIEGKKVKELEPENYAMYFLDNQNLEELWNWDGREAGLKITNGKLFFHYNPKLCVDKIRALERLANLSVADTRDVSIASNGDRTACKVEKLMLNVTEIRPESAVILFTNFLHLMKQKIEARSLLGYLINYKEAGSGNVSMFDDADACASEAETWKTKDKSVTVEDRFGVIGYNITNLKPFTRYAVYVKTYAVASVQFGGSSEIVYFTTAATVPWPPANVKAFSEAPDVLRVSWDPPEKPNGAIAFYVVVAVPVERNRNFIYDVDYCGAGKKMLPAPVASQEHPADVVSFLRPGGSNRTNSSGGEDCCECPKDKAQAALEEREHQERNEFENFLHNNIFVKRPLDYNQPSLRRKRDISEDADKNSFGKTPDGPREANTGKVPVRGGSTAEDPAAENRGGKHSFVRISNATSVKMTGAKHYSTYIVKVRACHGRPNHAEVNATVTDLVNDAFCSQESIVAAQTLAAPRADDVNATTLNATVSTKSAGSVFVSFEAPVNPNGLILKFDVETRRVDGNHNPTVTCLTYKKYLNGSGIGLTSLSSGRYSLRVSATTLWGSGEWSEPRYFYVRDPPSSLTPAIIGGIVAAVIVFLVLILLGVVLYVRKRELDIPAKLVTSDNPEYVSSDAAYFDDSWEVPREQIQLLRELGQGAFGMVFEGEAKDIVVDKPVVRCAVKTVNPSANLLERMLFLNEASVMKRFDCHHVVRLLGVVSKGQPTYVVMELMFHGDLKTYLRLHRPDEYPGKSPPSEKRILQMAVEIADGMAYLSSEKFVHRDLAARNCMVAEDLTVKIGDFGLTRGVEKEDYYRKSGKQTLLPMRWMAPECAKDGVFSSQSDVWSFGVVLWEMTTLGSMPYQGYSNEEVMKFVADGNTLKRPDNCPQILHELMRSCWTFKARHRPSFVHLVKRLLPHASARFSEVSFYQKDRWPELDNGEYATPDTPILPQHLCDGGDYTTLTGGESRVRRPRPQPPRNHRVVRSGQPLTSDGVANGRPVGQQPYEDDP